MSDIAQRSSSPIDLIKQELAKDVVQTRFARTLKGGTDAFTASLLDLYSGDDYLQKCDPRAVIMEAFKAAALGLPIQKSLGLAYIVPFGSVPTFVIGYKGLIQLALRSGQYKHLHSGVIYEGQKVRSDILSGEFDFSGEATSDKPIGYFAHLELKSGFRKTVYMTVEQVTAHAQKFSKSFNASSSPWKTDPEAMGVKTVLRKLIGTWGAMSGDLQQALIEDTDEEVRETVEQNGNRNVIDITGATEQPAAADPGW